MRYEELTKELNYWKAISGEENPEIVLVLDKTLIEINIISPSKGIEDERAIGIS